MGVDVELHAVGTVTDDEVASANRYLVKRGVRGEYVSQWPLMRSEWGVRWDTLHRFYGRGYERGPWPQIYNAIVCLRAALPHCEVRYGGDSDDREPPGEVVDDGWLSGMWRYWLSDEGVGYHERR